MGNPLKGRCGKCDHVFIVACLPMPLTTAAALMKRAACPTCGNLKPIYIATEETAS
ncbi:MAG: hypothetical protein AAAB20_23560 [Rhizobium sp.]|jgi:phage FluMu protein Com|uniref:hypothetical protein n=1 Tax=Rhizobium sp. TaxID=391 RepID=UPI0012E01B87